jgi:hypothetical protein
MGLTSTIPTWPVFRSIDRTIPDPLPTMASRLVFSRDAGLGFWHWGQKRKQRAWCLLQCPLAQPAAEQPGCWRRRYKHWGLVGPLNDTSEPNNYKYPELCAAANWTEVYGKPVAWGWSDANCLTKLPGLCRQQGGEPAAPRHPFSMHADWCWQRRALAAMPRL